MRKSEAFVGIAYLSKCDQATMNNDGKLIYEAVYPDERLSAFVTYFWHSQAITDSIYTVLPDGNFDLIIQFEATGIGIKSISLFGLYTRQVDIHVSAGSRFFAITFKPLAVEYLFKSTISSILNNYQLLSDNFWNMDQLSPEDFSGFIKQLTEKMLFILTEGRIMDNRKQKVFELIFSSKGTLPVRQIADQVFWTERQMNRYFGTRLGLSLKAYSNILRCAASYTDLRDGDIHPRQDFYDQSHFIKEIKKHTGQKPTELYENKEHKILQFLTLPE
ncbi:MAG: hypothetical protein JWM28_164 [Chitinophagaceae bacterium]|nr:hypothetical protein [Chitinophagaceae bacterium]